MKDTKHKIPYPVIIVKAVDWTKSSDYTSPLSVNDDVLLEAWICGFLIGQDSKSISIGFEFFDNNGDIGLIRDRIKILKSNIIYKKIVRV